MALTATDEKKITELQLISSILSSHMFPLDSGTQTYRATMAQLLTFVAPVYVPPVFETLLVGSGTWNRTYAFFVSGASVTIGATYTHNGVTYTAKSTVASSNYVVMSGNAPPLTSGTLTKASGTGDTSINFTSFRGSYLNVKAWGAGGGGAGSGTSPGAASDGAATTFGSSFITANGGIKGVNSSFGGAGGTASISSALTGLTQDGSQGGGSGSGIGGYGANAPFNSGGGSNILGAAGGNAAANSGGGGSGGGIGSGNGGSGGGSGGYAEAIVASPSDTYSYVVGAKGAKGTAGSGGTAGGDGGDGKIIVESRFQ